MKKRLFNKSNFNRLLLLEVTAYPGFYKVIILFFIKYYHNTAIMGNYVNDTSYAMLFGIFTYVNYSNFIAKDIPSLNSGDKVCLLNIIIRHVISASFLFALVGVILYHFRLVTECAGFVLFMITYSFYNVLRYYYIVEREYMKLFLYEFALIVLTFLTVIISPHNKVLLVNALCFLAFGLIAAVDLKLHRHIKANDYLKGIVKLPTAANYGMINVASSGLFLILPPISFNLLTDKYTALIGLTNNLTSVLYIFTRSFSYHFMPLMAINIKDKLALKGHLKKFKTYLFSLLIGGFLVCIIALYVLDKIHIKTDMLNLKGALYIMLLFLVATMISQLALPASNLLVLANKQRILLVANMSMMLIFIVVVFFLIQKHFFSNILLFDIILYLLIAINFFKFLWLNRLERGIFYSEY